MSTLVQKNYDVYVGIDCGKTGAIAAISANGSVLATFNTPVITTRVKKRKRDKKGRLRYKTSTVYNIPEIVSLFKQIADLGNNILITLEQQRQRPTDSKQTVFQIGYGQALWEMAAASFNSLSSDVFVLEKVTPMKWKPNYVDNHAEKIKSAEAASELFKAVPLKQLAAKNSAIAEALLLADYGRRLNLSLKFPKSV